MRKLLIGAVLAACVAGLGIWAIKDNARKVSQAISEQAKTVVAGAVHSVQSEITGRDIRISGIADSEAERDALISALNDIDGRGEVVDALEILPTATPFTFAATRKNGQTLLQGNVPSEDMRTILLESGAAGAESLALASGAPQRWEPAIGAALVALAKMDEGTVSVNGTAMRLTGIVDLPSDRDALIAAFTVPQGFTLKNDIETRDDGKPVSFEITYDASEGVVVEGKLPNGLDIAQIGDALGGIEIKGDAATGLSGDATPIVEILSKLAPWFEAIESASFSADGDNLRLQGVTQAGANTNEIQERMKTDLGENIQIALSPSTRLVDFTPSLQTCTAQTDQQSSTLKISFLSGSPNLAAESQRGIDALAQIILRCVRAAGLSAELGGHTDNQGSGNYELSAARAETVRAAMIARGVAAGAISAVGFGPSKPIAANATEVGRATNRRITVRWSQ